MSTTERRPQRGPEQHITDERLAPSSLFRQLLNRPDIGALAGVLLVFMMFAIVAGDDGFLTFRGTINYLEVAAQLGILSVAVSLLMIAGEFDLSIGSMIGAAGMVMAIVVSVYGWPLWAAGALAVVLAGLVGYFNAALVLRTGLPSFIVTLASLFMLRGLTVGFTRYITGRTIVSGLKRHVADDWLYKVFTGSPFGIPASIYWWIGLTVVATWSLTRTRFGNWVFGVGGDVQAARNVGVPVERVKTILFIGTALAATLVAALTVLSAGSADVLRGEQKEFEAIITAVIGGNLLTGGYGSVLGAAFGALIFGMVRQGFFFTGVHTDWFMVFLGAMLLVAVIFNNFLRKKAMKSR